MSEAEKRRRQAYRLGRKKWIRLQLLILAGILFLSLVFSVLYQVFNRATYIPYMEKSDVDYRVLLKENNFYDKPYAEEGKAYVTALIDKVETNFAYQMLMSANNVHFEYAYRIDAVLKVSDKSGAVIFEQTDALLPEVRKAEVGDHLLIGEFVSVDYAKYNDLAQEFTGFYELENTKSTLLLEMHISVIGACEDFSDDTNNQYVVALNVPLADKTVTMSVSSSVEEGDNFILACESETVKNVFLVLMIIFWILVVLGGGFIVVFVIITRNDDINYEINVNRILKSYRSFIQKLTNHFDDTGYRVLMLSTFTEMLEIRDTIQAPVLMDENDDKTCTRFLVPTNSNILYVFEIKAEDYDRIYAEEPTEVEPPAVEPAETEPEIMILENVEEELLAEAMDAPDVALEEIDFVDDEVIVEQAGVEVMSVVWPGKEKRNKLYRYDPNGEQVNDGDIVLVPSRDVAKNRDIVRKAAVAHGNHRVDPETLHHPLKKIIAIVKRKAEIALAGEAFETAPQPAEQPATVEAEAPVTETVETAETAETAETVETVETAENAETVQTDAVAEEAPAAQTESPETAADHE